MRTRHNPQALDLVKGPWTTKNTQLGSVYVKAWRLKKALYNEYTITAIYEMGARENTKLRVLSKYNNLRELTYTAVESSATGYPYATIPNDVYFTSPWGETLMVSIEDDDIQLYIAQGNAPFTTYMGITAS